MKKKIIIVLLILVVAAFGAYKFIYKEHRDIASEDASYTLTVPQVYTAFQKNDSVVNAKYANQTVEIHGKITAIDIQSKTITLDEKLSAMCTKGIQGTLKLQSSITLKGRIVGYNDLLDVVEMDQCTIKQ